MPARFPPPAAPARCRPAQSPAEPGPARGLAFGLTGCVTTGLPMARASPWQEVPLDTRSNPLDVAFTNPTMAFWWAATD